MTKVRIVGGGLMGVLAAFEAHRLGCRNIEIHERLECLGGEDLPERPQGLELRDEQIDFGPADGAVRHLLEWHGISFDEPPAAQNDKALVIDRPVAGEPGGGSLADWIRAHPAASGPLGRYCQWRLNLWLDRVDAGAAGALGLDGRPLSAAPRGGLARMFAACRRDLEGLGVKVLTLDLVSPQRAADWLAQGDTVVWASDPFALFRAGGMTAPKPLTIATPTYFFAAAYDGAAPARIRNFAAAGSVFAVHLYQDRGQTVVAAEAVAEIPDADLRREIGKLAAELGPAGLTLGDQLGVSLRPRRGFRSLAAARQLAQLRARLAQTFGPALVTDDWQAFAPADRFAGLSRGLVAALPVESSALPAAA